MRPPKPCLLPKTPSTRRQLLAHGVTAQMIRTALSSGRLYRIRRGVFIDSTVWPEHARDQHLIRALAELEVCPSGVLSHESAGAAWQLPHPGFGQWHDAPVSLTLPRSESSRARRGRVVHHLAELVPSVVTRDPEGRPVTTLARTAVDLATGRPLPEALVILDGAVRLLCAAMISNPRRTDYANPRLMAAARELFAQAADARLPAGLTQAIELTDARRESPPESLSAGHFHLAGLPEPAYQVMIDTPIGQLFPDFYWPEHRLVGECDGAVKYADPQGYAREKEREQVLRDLDYPMVRWLAKEIMLRPDRVIERVERALAAAPPLCG